MQYVMEWLTFLIGCCVGSLSGIIFCSWLEKRSERERNREIEISLRKEMEQLKALRKDKG
ncbi:MULTISPECIES: hypothetical protein [Bacillus cereus group]|uniref:hypothetical protein n=2 Tax=Bacillus TaxID=1386 RepID=UPI0008075FF4|nr:MULTISPECIES: hypothetical protein [Bacillus cereus group]OBZ59142.1 hypothetical protein UN66_09310 [Bacillus cereus]MCX3302846.1 hypothetical protein [Bacillus pacificus]MCX3329382.1 hypothetical protein [Bacillus pacificus]MDA2035468.1 hypothetical protein [Bacillus cereus group sp. Bcc02]OJE19712.1 hypothetical protein BAQ45_17245 [Bacillus pacificus]